MKKQSTLRVILQKLWSTFLNGLFTILPITLTIALFSFSFRLIKSWLAPVHRVLDKTIFSYIPHSEIFLIIIFIFLLGLILKVFILQKIIHFLESLIFKIPLIRPLYSGIKQLVHAFNFKEDNVSFKQVVLAEFPRKGLYSVGFLTGQVPPEIAPTQDSRYFNIFIPTTPNPTTGFFIIIPEADLIQVPLTRHEAMALIISGGIIMPERFASQQQEK